MKFLLDENIPVETAAAIRRLGHDVINVYDAGLQGKSDDKILNFAKKESRFLVTIDLDFSNIISYPPKSHPGIIVVKLHRPNRQRIISTIKQFIQRVSEKEIVRSLVILEDSDYRIRK